MPGKYPTINSNLTTRTTLTPGGTLGISNSDKNALKAMFPNSPIYSETASDYLTKAAALLQPSSQTGDSDIFPSGVSLDYEGSPDLSVPPLVDGVPFDTSYYPNLIANSDPAGGEGTATGAPLSPNDNFGTGSPVTTVTPSATATLINKQTFDSNNPDGKVPSLGDSGAQSVNPGATGQSGVE